MKTLLMKVKAVLVNTWARLRALLAKPIAWVSTAFEPVTPILRTAAVLAFTAIVILVCVNALGSVMVNLGLVLVKAAPAIALFMAAMMLASIIKSAWLEKQPAQASE